jgi:hypothetical protein
MSCEVEVVLVGFPKLGVNCIVWVVAGDEDWCCGRGWVGRLAAGVMTWVPMVGDGG